jgi:porphobilinogen synthase
MRELVAETRLHTSNFVAPLFVKEGISSPQPIASLPGVVQHSLDSIQQEVQELAELGVRGVILFGVPEKKDDVGSGAFDPQGIVQVALQRLTKAVGNEVVLMADLCVDEYTSHGHCGIVGKNGDVDNDLTLDIYAKIAVAQASAGAQVVAPSGMMDGQVGVIRQALDAHGFHEVSIMAYSAKYASGLYGPFRDAVDVSIANGGNRKGYQQDFRNARESLVEVQADIDQGADIVMVKPAVSYLDVIAAVRTMTHLPIAAYHVSGEYAMIKAAAANGWIDHDTVALEQLTAIRRAGADIILTYFTRWFAENNG